MSKLRLPTVTLVAVTSVNLTATCAALERCLDQTEFGDCLLLTHQADLSGLLPAAVRHVQINRLGSAADYSEFMLDRLVDHIATDHLLVVQWDGFIVDAGAWSDSFLDFDFVGARWPQFGDGYQVGNGGFSLRSRRLLAACRDNRFRAGHPEDVAICRDNRPFLEREHGISFADVATATRFSYEREPPVGKTFGFHGIFNLANALGVEEFWRVYRTLDEPGSVFTDFALIWHQLKGGKHRWRRRLRLLADYLGHRGFRSARPART